MLDVSQRIARTKASETLLRHEGWQPEQGQQQWDEEAQVRVQRLMRYSVYISVMVVKLSAAYDALLAYPERLFAHPGEDAGDVQYESKGD
jgi:hypothetical protein